MPQADAPIIDLTDAPTLEIRISGEPGGISARPTHVTETMVADTALGSVPADWDADRAVTALYTTHYRSLVRLAALLVRDVATAEEVVQDSFVAMHGGWRRLRDSDKALSYLRQSVVNRSRSVLRPLGRGVRVAHAAAAAARGTGTAVLRRSVRGPDRL